MQEFTGGDCYIFERRVNSGVTGTGKHKSCHYNVQSLVDRIGGERISCWFLNKDKDYELGIVTWIWHSLWKTPEGKIVDVTYDGTSETTGIFGLIIKEQRI